MVNARLHIICGNCGGNNYFTFQIVPENKECEELETVYLWCENCGTLHNIRDNSKPKEGV